MNARTAGVAIEADLYRLRATVDRQTLVIDLLSTQVANLKRERDDLRFESDTERDRLRIENDDLVTQLHDLLAALERAVGPALEVTT